MKVTVPRLIATATFLAVTGWTPFAEDYQCRRPGGCIASITEDGVIKQVTFRRGDLISTYVSIIIRTCIKYIITISTINLIKTSITI